VEEIHGQLKIGGGKKRVLLDWRGNGNRRRRRMPKSNDMYISRVFNMSDFG
jgi:hypothetical protein